MHNLPAEIRVLEEADGVRYVLPPRPSIWPRHTVRRVRATGIAWLVLGLCLMFGMLVQARLMAELSTLHYFLILALAGLLLTGFGAAMLLAIGGHSEVAVRDGMLCEVECLGPFRWINRRPIHTIRRFQIQPSRSCGEEAAVDEPTSRLWSICVDCDGAKPLRFVAPCCRRDWLRGLAQELASRCQQAAVADFGPQSSVAIPVIDESTDTTQPPHDSRLVVERHTDGITVIVPAVGLRSATVVILGVFALSFGVVASALVIGSLHRDDPLAAAAPAHPDTMNVLGSAAVCAIVAIGTAVYALSLARRRAVLAVVGNELVVLEEGFLRSRRRGWRRDELADIRSGPSELDINDTPVPQLQVHPVGGKHFGLLTGRSATDLEWIAGELSAALKLSNSAPADRTNPRAQTTDAL